MEATLEMVSMVIDASIQVRDSPPRDARCTPLMHAGRECHVTAMEAFVVTAFGCGMVSCGQIGARFLQPHPLC